MQVVQNESQGLPLSRVPEEGGHAGEQTKASVLRFSGSRHLQVWKRQAYLRHQSNDITGAEARNSFQLLCGVLAHVRADDLNPRPVSGGTFAFVATAPQHLHSTQPGV